MQESHPAPASTDVGAPHRSDSADVDSGVELPAALFSGQVPPGGAGMANGGGLVTADAARLWGVGPRAYAPT